MDSVNSKRVCRVMYAVILLTASIPVACAYIMEGGEILVWLVRIEEVAEGIRQGRWVMFPSPSAGGELHVLNSNFWLAVPALIRIWSGDIVTAYRIFMLLVNTVTLYGFIKMFGRIFEDKLTAVAGVALAMTCPYRIWLLYDQADLGKAAAGMLFPFFVWGMAGICRTGIRWRELLVSSFALAGIGYADGVELFVAAGCAVLGILWYKRVSGAVPVLAGCCLCLPGLSRLLGYLLHGGMEELGLPLQSIMGKGYVLGQFFTAYAYEEGRPGIGLGLFGALAALMWLCFVENGQNVMRRHGSWAFMSGLLLLMSLSRFPWDYVQRAGGFFLRLVSLIGSPGVFFGYACIFLSVPAAYGMECLRKRERLFVRVGIPLMVLLAAFGGAVYLCNALTFTRYPLIWKAGL